MAANHSASSPPFIPLQSNFCILYIPETPSTMLGFYPTPQPRAQTALYSIHHWQLVLESWLFRFSSYFSGCNFHISPWHFPPQPTLQCWYFPGFHAWACLLLFLEMLYGRSHLLPRLPRHLFWGFFNLFLMPKSLLDLRRKKEIINFNTLLLIQFFK